MGKTIAYADIFDYPLTAAEIRRWRIKGDSLPALKQKYYFLPGRKSLLALRRRREAASQKKWPKVKFAAKLLALIPWIKLAAVTGALAMNNSDKNDDIDLMIVTAKNRLWLCRLLALFLLLPWLRRGKKINNRVCLNLWLDETALVLKDKNLFTAHELCQAKPVLNRSGIYEKLIAANLWYKNYLPDWTI